MIHTSIHSALAGARERSQSPQPSPRECLASLVSETSTEETPRPRPPLRPSEAAPPTAADDPDNIFLKIIEGKVPCYRARPSHRGNKPRRSPLPGLRTIALLSLWRCDRHPRSGGRPPLLFLSPRLLRLSSLCSFPHLSALHTPSTAQIFETEHALAFLDAFPMTRGHALLIPKARPLASSALLRFARRCVTATWHAAAPHSPAPQPPNSPRADRPRATRPSWTCPRTWRAASLLPRTHPSPLPCRFLAPSSPLSSLIASPFLAAGRERPEGAPAPRPRRQGRHGRRGGQHHPEQRPRRGPGGVPRPLPRRAQEQRGRPREARVPRRAADTPPRWAECVVAARCAVVLHVRVCYGLQMASWGNEMVSCAGGGAGGSGAMISKEVGEAVSEAIKAHL